MATKEEIEMTLKQAEYMMAQSENEPNQMQQAEKDIDKDLTHEEMIPSVTLTTNPWTLDVNQDRLSTIDPDKIAASLVGKDIKENTPGYQNLKFIIQDILSGDQEALKRPEYACLNLSAVRDALNWLLTTDQLTTSAKANLATDSWRLNFRDKPPTPLEFLSEKYIGPMAETVFPWIKERFPQMMDPLKPYRNHILYSCIGSGKSLITVLTNLFISTHFALMWHPYKYFGQSVSTQYCNVLCATSQKKGSELLLEPMLNIIENCDFWQKCRTKQDMVREEQAFEAGGTVDHINWTTATPSSFLSTSNGLNYKLISGANGLLGQTIVCGAITEFGFFYDAGWSEQKIMTFFNKLAKRIDSRMAGNYYGRFVIDSSPNTLESPIDDWILNQAKKQKKNYISRGARWDMLPWQFPDLYNKETKKIDKDWKGNWDLAFPLFKGGNGKPPMTVETQESLSLYDPADIIWVPRNYNNTDFKDACEENTIEFLKDWCGIPAGEADRIFTNGQKIEDCFDNDLRNIMTEIVAPAEQEPEHLIWDQVKDKFFQKAPGKYYFYYEPDCPRVVSVDQSLSGDVTGIAMSHLERDPEKIDPITGAMLSCVVTDFTIVIKPAGGYINLDAIKYFILDLKTLGNINLTHVSYDGFQSDSSRQFLQRHGITVNYVSVDKTNDAYLSFIDLVQKGRYHCGKNLYMKNNMRSLQMRKRKQTGTVKIDHMDGDLVTDGPAEWDKNQRGINAKDACDAVAANIQLMNLFSTEFVPTKIWYRNQKINTYENMTTATNNLLKKLEMF